MIFKLESRFILKICFVLYCGYAVYTVYRKYEYVEGELFSFLMLDPCFPVRPFKV